ncbi:MAG: hypothetical protein ACYTDY_01870 [Planctomycetota bacterium]
MAVRCPRCGSEFDITLFSFGNTVRCDCGGLVSAHAPHRALAGDGEGAPPIPDLRERESRRKMSEISRGADRISSMILYGDYEDVDVAIAIERLRERAEELFPGRGWLFEIVYESRFQRLKEQWG